MSILYLETRDAGLPPPAEFHTLGNWLGALPRGTVLVVTKDEVPMQMCVEDVIEHLASHPLMAERLRMNGDAP